MVTIRNFQEQDCFVLQQYKYQNKSIAEVKEMIAQWNTKQYDGKYFEMFAICLQEEVVGLVSLYQHNDHIISAGPIIFQPFRRLGYGYAAIHLAYKYAKGQGYKIASAQIKTDNIASIRLHEKFGFQRDCKMINRNGNEVYIYLKRL